MNWLFDFFSPRTFGAIRSPQWNGVEQAHLKEEPLCQVCGSKGGLLNPLNVHHCQPFHLHPELELQDSNLITLCRKDHFLFGHLNNWASYNIGVRNDSTSWKQKITARP